MSPTVWVVEEFGRGGIARYSRVVAGLLGHGSTVVLATTCGGDSAGSTRTVTWFPRHGGRRAGKLVSAGAGLLRAATEVHRGDVAWIPLGLRPAYEVALLSVLRARGAAGIVTVHNRAPHGRGGTSRLVLAAARRAAAVVVHTEAMADWARDHGLNVVQLPFPEPGAVPSGRLDRAALGVPPDALLVVALGNQTAYKGFDVLVDAVGRANVDGLHLVIAGQRAGGPDFAALAEQLSAKAEITVRDGYLADGDLVDLLAAADAVALPYRAVDHTGLGRLAVSLRKPAVASDLPALRECFGAAALYARPGDVDDLAARLRELTAALPELQEAADRAQLPDATDPTPWVALINRVAR